MCEASKAGIRATLAVDLLTIVFLTLFMRVYGIQDESVWMDEFLSANYLDRPDVSSFLAEQRRENWEMVPLYYVLEYGWSRLYPGNMVWVRLLSVLFSLVSAVLVYCMGRRFLNRTAGGVGALMFALSPFQLFHGQEIRPYALVTLLALLSSAAFLEWHARNKPVMLVVHLCANLLILWTHLLSPILFVVQGVFLLSTRIRKPSLWAPWLAAHVVIIGSIFFALAGITRAPDPTIPRPQVGDLWDFITGPLVYHNGSLIHSAFLNESEYIRWTVGFPGKYGASGLSETAMLLIQIRHPLELALGRICLVSLVFVALSLFLRRRTVVSEDPASSSGAALILYAYLAFLGSLVLLFLLCRFWKMHVFQGRYIIYAWPFLYLLCGAAVAQMRFRPAKALLATVFVGAMSLLGLTGILLPLRIDYQGASRYIGSSGSANYDLFVDDYNTHRLLLFNMHSPPPPWEICFEPERMATLLDTALKRNRDAWIVYCGEGSTPRRNQLLEYAHAKGLPHSWRVFLGMQNLIVYHFSPEPVAERSESEESPGTIAPMVSRPVNGN